MAANGPIIRPDKMGKEGGVKKQERNGSICPELVLRKD